MRCHQNRHHGFSGAQALRRRHRRLRRLVDAADRIGRRQVGVAPAAAQRQHQVGAGREPIEADRQQGLLGRQGRGLGLHHRRVGHGAQPILVERQPLGVARGGDGGALHPLLLLEHALLHQCILDLLEGHQDGLAIERDLGIVARPGALDLRLERAAVDQRRRQGRADRPHRVAEREQRVQAAADQGDGAGERDAGIVGGDGHADLGVGRRHLALGRGDVGPPLEQGRGDAGLDGRHRRRHRPGLDAELGRRLAGQHGHGMLEGGAGDVLGDQLGARLLELGLRLGEVDAAHDAGIELVLHDLDRARVGRHRRLVDPHALLGDAHGEVVDRHVGLRRQPGIGEVGGRGLGRRRIALDLAADAAPQVDLPVEPRPGAELADAARARVDHGALDSAARA